jgi:hypothetical protein
MEVALVGEEKTTAEMVAAVKKLHARCLEARQKYRKDAVAAGQLLHELRRRVQGGRQGWQAWCRSNLDISQATVSRYVAAYEKKLTGDEERAPANRPGWENVLVRGRGKKDTRREMPLGVLRATRDSTKGYSWAVDFWDETQRYGKAPRLADAQATAEKDYEEFVGLMKERADRGDDEAKLWLAMTAPDEEEDEDECKEPSGGNRTLWAVCERDQDGNPVKTCRKLADGWTAWATLVEGYWVWEITRPDHPPILPADDEENRFTQARYAQDDAMKAYEAAQETPASPPPDPPKLKVLNPDEDPVEHEVAMVCEDEGQVIYGYRGATVIIAPDGRYIYQHGCTGTLRTTGSGSVKGSPEEALKAAVEAINQDYRDEEREAM